MYPFFYFFFVSFFPVKREQDSVLYEEGSVPVHVLERHAEGILPRPGVCEENLPPIPRLNVNIMLLSLHNDIYRLYYGECYVWVPRTNVLAYRVLAYRALAYCALACLVLAYCVLVLYLLFLWYFLYKIDSIRRNML